MKTWLQDFFNSDYMPHGHCYFWQPGILWTNVIADLLIALAYFSIPILLFRFIQHKKNLQYRNFLILFALFIFCCGITHLLAIFTIWHGIYGIHGISKAITATISVFTAVSLIRHFDTILQIPTPAELKEALNSFAQEKIKRHQLENDRKSEGIFKFAIELLPTGLLVINKQGKIRIANEALEQMFGYQKDELNNRDLSCLLMDEQAAHHDVLIQRYLDNPSQGYAMASGRIVHGKTKSGDSLAIEISLSAHELDGVMHAFASVNDISSVSSQKSLFLEQNNRLNRAIDATNDGIWEWNIQNGKVWYSSRLLRMIGRPDETNPQLKHWLQHIHPSDKSKVEAAIEQHFTSGAMYDVSYRGKTESGDYEWLRARGDTLFDANNKPLLMSGILTNIDSIKMLEKRLQEKTRTLNQVLQKSLCAIYIYDIQQHQVTFFNPEFQRITGYQLNELNTFIKDDLYRLFHHDDSDKIKSHYKEVLESHGDEVSGLQYRMRHKDGHWVWCYSRDSILSHNADHSAKEFLGTFFDISTLKQHEIEIQQLAQDFYTTFEQAAVGIAHVSMEGRFLKANSRLCEILGYERPALLNTTFQSITHEDDLEADLALHDQLIAGDIDHYTLEKRYIRAGGEVIWANLTVTIVLDEKGNNSHFISVIQDISARKKIELSLAESNAALERFAYSASHDLQEPLRKINAFSGSLKRRLQESLNDEDARFELDRICDASSRMSEMINSLLQLSRYSSSKVQRQPTTLQQMLEQVTDDLSALISEHKAQIICDTDAALYVDPNAFQQVLRNLISNSINYAHPERALLIRINCQEHKNTLLITYQDNGSGFDMNQTEQVFEPFRRLVGRDKPGSGMGLAICRQIINAHNGHISALSELGEGTQFTIELPLVKS